MILRIALASLTALWALSAQAQNVPNPTPPNSINGAYNASAPVCIDGNGCWIQTDINGNIKVVTSGSPVAPVGGSNYVTTQISVATTDTAVVAARTGRQSVRITNVTGTQQVWCSGTTAATNTSELMPAAVGASLTISTASAVRCIASTGAQTVSVAEVY
jgi:hypothetical protein